VTFDQTLASRVRALLAVEGQVAERRMFGGLAFMMDGRMCVTVGKERLMLRVDPAVHDELLHLTGCTAVLMRGRRYRGWVHVTSDVVASHQSLTEWLAFATRHKAGAAR
jgi:TfoX/Sxy family transcriptional regulator of competence genes